VFRHSYEAIKTSSKRKRHYSVPPLPLFVSNLIFRQLLADEEQPGNMLTWQSEVLLAIDTLFSRTVNPPVNLGLLFIRVIPINRGAPPLAHRILLFCITHKTWLHFRFCLNDGSRLWGGVGDVRQNQTSINKSMGESHQHKLWCPDN